MKKLISFVKSVINELKLVEWISGRDTARLTAIVLVVVIFMGLFIAFLDFAFLKVRTALF